MVHILIPHILQNITNTFAAVNKHCSAAPFPIFRKEFAKNSFCERRKNEYIKKETKNLPEC